MLKGVSLSLLITMTDADNKDKGNDDDSSNHNEDPGKILYSHKISEKCRVFLFLLRSPDLISFPFICRKTIHCCDLFPLIFLA